MDESQQQFQAELDGVHARLQRGKTGLLIGAIVGVACALGLGFALGPENTSVWDLAAVATFGCFGAGIGHLAGAGRLEARTNSALGFDLAVDRIKRVVRGEENVALSPEQQRRAARYAALTVLVSPAQSLRWALFISGLLTGQFVRLIESAVNAGQPFASITPAAIGIFSALALVALIPSRLRSARHAREYSQTHPWQEPFPRTGDVETGDGHQADA